MDNFNDITISKLQVLVDDWITEHGVRYFSELTNMTILTEEVGELARLMARTYGDQSYRKKDLGKNIADELADIIWVTTCLANQMNIDLEKAIAANFEKKTKRDLVRHKKNDKLR